MQKHYIYILLCSDNTYYTGYTNNIEKRLEKHNSGTGAKYTRGRLPVNIIYSEEYDDEGKARSREYEIKQLSRKQKEVLIKKLLNKISSLPSSLVSNFSPPWFHES